MKPAILTIEQAATRIGVSSKAVYAAIAQKRLPRRYHRGNMVVRESDLEAWEARKKKSGRPTGKPLTDAHKARISASLKQRWSERKRKS